MIEREHGQEPVRGLPEALPAGERILWQGSPHWPSLARHVLHTRLVAAYFAVLIAWRMIDALDGGASVTEAAIHASVLLPLGLAAIGILSLLAWTMARSTIYTITDKRIVLRYGVALEKAINVPFKIVGSAALKEHKNGTGDIPITLIGEDSIAYLHLWPHARPWRFKVPEPMLRFVPDAKSVASLLSRALVDATGDDRSVAPRSADERSADAPADWTLASAAAR